MSRPFFEDRGSHPFLGTLKIVGLRCGYTSNAANGVACFAKSFSDELYIVAQPMAKCIEHGYLPASFLAYLNSENGIEEIKAVPCVYKIPKDTYVYVPHVDDVVASEPGVVARCG